jgi:glycosyltransferase involved in cell wall biosynthesis
MKISIVTPSFNQGRFIGRTLASVATQAGVDREHVVFDAGSTDETLEVLRGAQSPVRWVSEADRGQAHAVNKGIAATDGELIGWLNSDDLYLPGALSTVVAFFEAHPEVDVAYGDADHIDADDRAFEPYPTEDWSLEALQTRAILCQPATFFRRRTVERFGALDESLQYCMDYELWLRWSLAGASFARIPAKLAGSRLYADNKTLGSRVKVHAEINDMLKRTLGRVPDRWLVNYAFAAVQGSDARSAPNRLAVLREALAASRRWNGGAPGAGFWWRLARRAP